MKKKIKVFALVSVCTLVLSSLPVSAHYREKGCHHYNDYTCFHDDTIHHCDNYVDVNNDGYCDHCYRINHGTTIVNDDNTMVTTTYNSGNTIYYGGHHHAHHGHHHH